MNGLFITKDVPSSAARTAKEAALLLCVFDEEDAWSAPPRANDGDCNKFEHENDISAFSFASQRLLWVCFVIRCVVKLRAFRSREFVFLLLKRGSN